MNNLHDEILLLKIKRDSNKKIKNEKYQKLINLVNNHILHKISIKNIDIQFFEKIIKHKNVFITKQPFFNYTYIENNNIFNKMVNVGDMFLNKNNLIDLIKENDNYIFYIYKSIDNHHRFAKIEDKNFKKRIRKDKLINLS